MTARGRIKWCALILALVFFAAGPAEVAGSWRIDQLDDIYMYRSTFVVPVWVLGGSSQELPVIMYPDGGAEDAGLVVSVRFSTVNGALNLRMPLVDMDGPTIIVTENNGYAYLDLLYPWESVSVDDVGKKVLKPTPFKDYDGIYVLDTDSEGARGTRLLLPLVYCSDSTGFAMPLIPNPFVENDGYIIPVLKMQSHNFPKPSISRNKWGMEYDALAILDYETVGK
ncbi:MAG: hypothetical protein JSW28_07965 [Thermoplasmata archaeon]|nr:MAG: hypothetical protein JSW28_07965 [Thermoplasmata archaeon]